MKSVFCLLIIIGVLSSEVVAQGKGQICLHLAGGVSLKARPDPFLKDWKEGLHLTGSLGCRVGPGFWIRSRVGYHHFSLKDFENVRTSGGELKTYLFGIDAMVCPQYPTNKFIPYAFFGLGASICTLEAYGIRVVSPIGNNDLYANLGGGIDFRLCGGFSVFAELSHVYIASPGESVGFWPISAGIKSYIGKIHQTPIRLRDGFDVDAGTSAGGISAFGAIGGTLSLDTYHRKGFHVFFDLGRSLVSRLSIYGKCEYHFLVTPGTDNMVVVGANARLFVHAPEERINTYVTAGIGYPYATHFRGLVSYNGGAGILIGPSKKSKFFFQLRYTGVICEQKYFMGITGGQKHYGFLLLEIGKHISSGRH